MTTLFSSLVSGLAGALAAAWAPLRAAAGPAVRVGRLVSLRARTRGSIPVSTQFDGPVRTAGANVRLTLGEHCRLGHGVFFDTVGAGAIRLGAHVRINQGCVLVSYASVAIGDECLIGEYVTIRDANHGMDTSGPMRLQPHTSAPITIGRDVWIARGAVILKGVTIGDGAVVAANSVVTADVLPMTIVGGAPARVIRRRDGQPEASA